LAIKLKSMFAGFLRSLHALWLEVVGAMLLALAALIGFHTFQEFRRYLDGHTTGLWLLVAAGCVSVLALAFGVHSFWRARKLRP
jgi:EamA domain-containing membrane protein RarD